MIRAEAEGGDVSLELRRPFACVRYILVRSVLRQLSEHVVRVVIENET